MAKASRGIRQQSTASNAAFDNGRLSTINIDHFLAGEGFDTAIARHRARRILEQAGLTNPRKRGIDESKLPRARAAIDEAVTRCCEGCWPLAAKSPTLVLIDNPERCSICHGSNNRRAALELVGAMQREGARNLLVVGGTPANHKELGRLLGASPIELRCIDGAGHAPTQKEAWGHLQWADVTVIWASTPLPHKVSNLFTAERLGRPPITVAQRGIEALCHAATKSLAMHGLGRPRR